MDNGVEQARYRLGKLHRLCGGLVENCNITAAPHIIIYETGAVSLLGNKAQWAYPKSGQIPDVLPGEDNNMPHSVLCFQLCSNEGGVSQCRGMKSVPEHGA